MFSHDMPDEDRADWLRLFRSENIGPVAFQRLLQRFGTVAAAIEAIPDLVRNGGKRLPAQIVTRAQAEDEIAATQALGGRVIALPEPDYPALLREIHDPPPVISIFGNPSLYRATCVAIVGARNASSNGMRMASTIAQGLTEHGLTVVSGLARGIDAAAHSGANSSRTIAVVPGGLDVIYPRENTKLYDAIRDSGCIISEMPLGTQPQARHFPRRNRIVSGLSQGTIVIEATLKSGSLITARLANEQGRDVMAVPGFPGDSRATGPNSLIKNGAALVENVDDILETLQYASERQCMQTVSNTSPAKAPIPSCLSHKADSSLTQSQKQEKLLEALNSAPMDMDMLLRECGLNAAEGAVILLELELAGRIERQPGNQVSLLSA